MTLRRLNMLFSLCNGVSIAMVEGNHRMFYCCMKLYGREEYGKDTPFPFGEAYKRLRTDCAYFESVAGFDVVVHNGNGIPSHALSVISNWYQEKNNEKIDGQFLTALNKFLYDNKNKLLTDDDAMLYLTDKGKREKRDKTTVDLLLKLCEEILKFGNPLNTRHLQATTNWITTFTDTYSKVVIRYKKETNTSGSTPSKRKSKKDTEMGTHQTQLNFRMPDTLVCAEMTNAKGKPGNISFDGRNLWNINLTIRNLIGTTTAKQTVKETYKLFHDHNPLLMVGLTDLVMVLNCFPSLQQKIKALQSELDSSSYANNLEFFVVNILIPVQQLARISEYAFVLAYSAREFINPRTKYTGGRVVKQDDEESYTTHDGLVEGLNENGKVYVREKDNGKWYDKVSDGPLQDYIRYVYKTTTYRPARREFTAMAYNLWLTTYIDAMIAEQKKEFKDVNKNLEEMTQEVYKGMFLDVFG